MTVDSHKLAEFIEGQGWSSYGVVSLEEVQKALGKHEQIFETWFSKGFGAGMDYLKFMKKDRYHPVYKLPDVKSFIVLQAWYGSLGRGDRNTNEDAGMVAQYARGLDYHGVLQKKLKALSAWLQGQDSGILTYASVDSGPTVDRALAEAAGLGFFGKNTNLIDPSKGSYFFIACMLVNEVLPPIPKRLMPSCGDCRKCAQACPTAALVSPYTLDARRCVAYLTIENREGISPEFRSLLADRILGCDRCQEVCPFNEGRASQQSIRIDELRPENGVGDRLDLREILAIGTDEEFEKRFAGTPLMRAKRRGLLRNACVVAGNIGEKTLIPFLEALHKRETDPMLREHASWAINEIGKRAK